MTTYHARKLAEIVLAKGYSISLNDGGEWVAIKAKTMAEIKPHIHTVDEERWKLHNADGTTAGILFIVYGNDADELICDHTDNAAMTEVFDAYVAAVR